MSGAAGGVRWPMTVTINESGNQERGPILDRDRGDPPRCRGVFVKPQTLKQSSRLRAVFSWENDMQITTGLLNEITGSNKYQPAKAAFCKSLNRYADLAPHEMAQLLAQVLHESAGFRYTKEIWGPTAAQSRYEGRRDLGNTQRGDGKRFMGRDLIQITGRDNYRALTKWARELFGGRVPDFEAEPDLLLDHIGLGVLWFWTVRVPQKYVDGGNIEMVTRRVNGGLNGYSDRLRWYDRAALVLLSLAPTDVRGFQVGHGLKVDGISGPETRAALHKALVALGDRVEPPATSWIQSIIAILKGLTK